MRKANFSKTIITVAGLLVFACCAGGEVHLKSSLAPPPASTPPPPIPPAPPPPPARNIYTETFYKDSLSGTQVFAFVLDSRQLFADFRVKEKLINHLSIFMDQVWPRLGRHVTTAKFYLVRDSQNSTIQSTTVQLPAQNPHQRQIALAAMVDQLNRGFPDHMTDGERETSSPFETLSRIARDAAQYNQLNSPLWMNYVVLSSRPLTVHSHIERSITDFKELFLQLGLPHYRTTIQVSSPEALAAHTLGTFQPMVSFQTQYPTIVPDELHEIRQYFETLAQHALERNHRYILRQNPIAETLGVQIVRGTHTYSLERHTQFDWHAETREVTLSPHLYIRDEFGSLVPVLDGEEIRVNYEIQN